MFNKYFQDELVYLRQLGAEFARAHPTAAHYLESMGSDPDVERLLEGFAFLSGRLREKLDDELPEVTHSLITLLWPHYLRPIPSCSILEFSPVQAALRHSQRIPRGVDVQSVPVEGTPCRFRTTSPVLVNPISLERVNLETQIAGNSRLLLDFRIWNQALLETLDMKRVRLYLHGDRAESFALYFHLCRHVKNVVAVPSGEAGEGEGTPTFTVPVSVEPAGFAEDEALIPYPAQSFAGYRLLQEYFALPEKFLFVDIVGLDKLAGLEVGEGFRVQVQFDLALPTSLRPSKDEIRLYCTPVANVFAHETDPFRVDGTQTEYRLRPSGSNPFHYEIFSIDRVSGHVSGTAQERVIPPFYSFVHGRDGGDGSYYHVRLKNSVVDDRSDVYLSFSDANGENAVPSAETIAVEATCTNRRLPEALRVGDIRIPTDTSPEFAQFRNISTPTASAAPPLEGDLHWRLISHMSMNYVSLASVEALRGILELYNFQALRDPRAARANARRIEGLSRVRGRPKDVLHRGSLIRGWEVAVDVLEDHFAGDGDLYLFFSILNRFLSLHASINSFTELRVQGLQKGERLSWPLQIGQRSLL